MASSWNLAATAAGQGGATLIALRFADLLLQHSPRILPPVPEPPRIRMLHALPHVANGDEVDLDSSGHWLPEHHRPCELCWDQSSLL